MPSQGNKPPGESASYLSRRYEAKYLIDETTAERIRQFIAPYTELDYYTKIQPRARYPVMTLYFDNDRMAIYRATVEGQKRRFKIRVRSYSDDPLDPVFPEIKRRNEDVILKTRCHLCWPLAARLLQDHPEGDPLLDAPPTDEDTCSDPEAYNEFLWLKQVWNVHPKYLIRYEREAYMSAFSDPVRVTFDWDIRYRAVAGEDLREPSNRWFSIDSHSLVLEIKFTSSYPFWVRDLLQRFELMRTGFGKYIRGVQADGNRRSIPRQREIPRIK